MNKTLVSRELVGIFALDWLERLHLDYAPLGSSAIDGDSVLNTEVNKRAENVFLLADNEKCNDGARVEFSKLDDFGTSIWINSVPHSRLRSCVNNTNFLSFFVDVHV